MPGLLLLHELIVQRASTRPAGWSTWAAATLTRLLPYLGLLGGYLLLRVWVLGGGMVPGTPLHRQSPATSPSAPVCSPPSLWPAATSHSSSGPHRSHQITPTTSSPWSPRPLPGGSLSLGRPPLPMGVPFLWF